MCNPKSCRQRRPRGGIEKGDMYSHLPTLKAHTTQVPDATLGLMISQVCKTEYVLHTSFIVICIHWFNEAWKPRLPFSYRRPTSTTNNINNQLFNVSFVFQRCSHSSSLLSSLQIGCSLCKPQKLSGRTCGKITRLHGLVLKPLNPASCFGFSSQAPIDPFWGRHEST